ncbi:MAG: UxaA family hydrolase [Chromatiales bacterium]|jgi:altronate dehydratase large subunit|nr:UxaA family hydrolase [Chromatiales bacterium]
MAATFLGYRRSNGQVGVRNLVAILSAMDNTNPTAERISSMVAGTVVLSTPFGRGQIGDDFNVTLKTLAGIANHPNIAAVLVLSLSLKSGEYLAGEIAKTGKPVEVLGLQEGGSAVTMTAEGVRIAATLVADASELVREPCGIEELTVAVECGGSDTTSGLASNPAVGRFADRLIDAGGTIILSEPAEFMGAEHLLAARTQNEADAQAIYDMVQWFEDEAKRNGVDMRWTNPTPDNIEGGLTTLEEKSLGAIAKGGTRPIVEVIDYSDNPTKQGLVIMNTPSAACESMTGLVAGGAQIIIFSTGRGNAIGAPVAPTLKVTGNPNTAVSMAENIDVDVSGILTDGDTLDTAGGKVWEQICKVATGKLTRCEILYEQQLSVSRFGPSV